MRNLQPCCRKSWRHAFAWPEVVETIRKFTATHEALDMLVLLYGFADIGLAQLCTLVPVQLLLGGSWLKVGL